MFYIHRNVVGNDIINNTYLKTRGPLCPWSLTWEAMGLGQNLNYIREGPLYDSKGPEFQSFFYVVNSASAGSALT